MIKGTVSFFLLAWLTYLVVTVLFYTVGGDAPSYFYSIHLMLDGQVPIIDFFALQPPGFFLPFYIIGKLISPSWEAMRLLSLASFVSTCLITTYIVRRQFGDLWAGIAFVLMGFSHFWFYWNATIIHYSVTNFLFMTAFVLLHYRPPSRVNSVVLGFVLGWCVNSRLIMGPVTLFFLYLLMQNFRAHASDRSWWNATMEVVPPFLIGGLVGAAPGILVFLMDPTVTYLNLLNLRSALAVDTNFLGETLWQQFLTVFQRRLENIPAFFFWIDTSQKAQICNSVVLLIASFGFIGMAINKRGKRLQAWLEFKNNPLTRSAGLVAFAIFITHAVTIFPAPYYVQGVFPFLVIMALSALYFGTRNLALPKFRQVSLAVIGLALVPYTLYFMAWTGGGIVRRNEPSSARPVTMAAVGCWLEQHTSEDAQILSYTSSPVAMANRRMPKNWTYPPFQTATLGAQGIDADVAAAARILTREDFLDLFRKRELNVFINDRHAEGDFKEFDALRVAIAENYKLAVSTGGPFPFDLYVPRDKWGTDMLHFPSPPKLRVSIQRIREASIRELGVDIFADITDSMRILPRDIKIAFARLRNAPFNERCKYYLKFTSNSTKFYRNRNL